MRGCIAYYINFYEKVNMNPLTLKLLIALTVMVISFGAGWRVKGAFVAERDLAIAEAQKAMIEAYRANEANQARILEDKLAELKENERVIEKERVRIVENPVYLNNCLSSDGVQLINQARAGKADPAKPADQVPAAK